LFGHSAQFQIFLQHFLKETVSPRNTS
jgi:hypothetical protein